VNARPDTIASGFVDIHAHVLPGIDDGPRDLEQALEMVQAAAEAGISTIATTPHLRHDFPDVHIEELAERWADMREAIEQHHISLELVLGAEVSPGWALEASDEQLALASYGQRGTDLLLETPTTNAVAIEPVVAHLAAKGYRITLAHPERGLSFQRNNDWLRPLVERGLLLVVNAEALQASRASPSGRLARHLLTEGLAHAIASDGHRGTHWRPVTALAPGVEAAAALVGPERAAWMASAAPRAIIEGAPVPEAPPVVKAGKRRRLFGLLK
jgi:protein-tyrosine phosphatase